VSLNLFRRRPAAEMTNCTIVSAKAWVLQGLKCKKMKYWYETFNSFHLPSPHFPSSPLSIFAALSPSTRTPFLSPNLLLPFPPTSSPKSSYRVWMSAISYPAGSRADSYGRKRILQDFRAQKTRLVATVRLLFLFVCTEVFQRKQMCLYLTIRTRRVLLPILTLGSLAVAD